jgi:hypothetical protein
MNDTVHKPIGSQNLLSGTTQGNPRADSDEETVMNETKCVLLHRAIWSADPGELG